MLFLGVSTGGSSIMELFPRWADVLGVKAGIQGRDLPLAGPPDVYVQAVREIADDPGTAGALVTSHKVDVYRHAGELFQELDGYAHLCREISCISKRDGRLVGHAKDPITAGLAMEHMLGPDYFRDRDAEVLCLGAGGAGTAITVHLSAQSHRPQRVIVADRDPDRIKALASIVEEARAANVDLTTVGAPEDADRLLALPRGSLVINATGLGKDLPGSPLSGNATFPEQAVVWDLNYRGDLEFLRQARDQAERRGLRLHDGWRYFLHGWTEVIAEVYDLDLTPALFERLAATADPFRPATPASV
ncbi:MAG TPA: saccharopine dehydrogenase NADP-binding domain-containing protein [Actinomycetota bacterium]|nr:saccharopine dehydrogenase NADP-binding domain-containing protein [Actinomycetota bacterium]